MKALELTFYMGLCVLCLAVCFAPLVAVIGNLFFDWLSTGQIISALVISIPMTVLGFRILNIK